MTILAAREGNSGSESTQPGENNTAEGDASASERGDGTSTQGGDGDGGPDYEEWILSVEEPGGSVHRLVKVSTEPMNLGAVTEVCVDIGLPGTIPADTNIASLTFKGTQLYASAEGASTGDTTLILIDPCLCTATVVGAYGYNGVNGITSNMDRSTAAVWEATRTRSTASTPIVERSPCWLPTSSTHRVTTLRRPSARWTASRSRRAKGSARRLSPQAFATSSR